MNKEFIQNISKIQSELKAPKSQFNKFGGYKYRSCEDIVEATKLVLEPYGYILSVSDEIVLIGDRFYIKATASITDGEDTVTTVGYAREELSVKGMSSAQVTGATSSYARKYALNGLLAIDDAKDPDTDEYKKQQKNEPKISLTDDIKKQINACTSLEQVTAIWKGYPTLHKDNDFVMLVSAKGKEFKK